MTVVKFYLNTENRMKYFTIDELCASDTARRKGIDNTPNADARLRMQILIEQLLDPIRAAWGGPITVNSGYRSPELNKKVGGVSNSQHLKGEAADITVGSQEANKQLFDLIVELRQNGRISFDQLIDESNYSWLHISFKATGNRNQVLHKKG